MILSLILSSIAAGLIATLVMVIFLYLPILWNGDYYDVLGAIGSAMTKEVDARSRFLGGVVYFLGGILVALVYGWLVQILLEQTSFNIPKLVPFTGLPVEVNLFYPLLGIAIGMGHGVFIGLLTTILVEHHPLPHYQTRHMLIISQLISHIAFGATVMFFHSQFLQLLMGQGAPPGMS